MKSSPRISSEMKQLAVAFLLCHIVIFGSAYNVQHHYDSTDPRGLTDTVMYMRMAQGDHGVEDRGARYRVVVPMLVRTIEPLVSHIYRYVWPAGSHDDEPQWTTSLCFLLVNSTLFSMAVALMFRLCILYGASFAAAAGGTLPILVSWQTSQVAGAPLTDSLYILVIAAVLYGIKARSHVATLFAIFMGPFAKEAFILFVPLIFFSGHLSKSYKALLLLLAGILVSSVRIAIDYSVAQSHANAVQKYLSNTGNVLPSLIGLLTLTRIVQLWNTFGWFNLILLCGFLGGTRRSYGWLAAMDAPCLGFVLVVFAHMLLTGGGLARMAFFAAPVFAIAVALILDTHPVFARFRSLMKFGSNAGECTL